MRIRSVHSLVPLPAPVAAAAFLVLSSASPAGAIPSPELVAGSLTSLSQLVALASALLGGGALAAGSRLQGRPADIAVLRRLKRAVAALALTAAAAMAFAAYLHVSAVTAERQRLEQTLMRPAPKAKGQSLDPNLTEISYRRQVSHPLGVDTQAAQAIATAVAAGQSKDWLILDIRETAETEMGSLAGAVKIRFPDLAGAKLNLQGKKALLICHNGNRSAQSCEALAARGIDCGFIAGGLEKWLAEGRTLADGSARTLQDLRALPAYPNNDVLLDTDAVKLLVFGEEAVFVDVRYPGEFNSGHLPGAINLPIRPTPSEQLAKLIEALPQKPVIAPCYDRRSCFFSEILGLSLTRAGRDFRGRYTVPWEYFTTGSRPPHVEALIAERSKTFWTRLQEAFNRLLIRAATETGLVTALLAMAVASRLLVLPFSLKAERDQMVSRRLTPRLNDLKEHLAQDPQRLHRAVRRIYRENGLTPGRNLLALAFLPVLALAVSAAIAASKAQQTAFYWISDLSGYDPLHILPSVFAALIGVYLHQAFVSSRWHALAVWLFAVPLLGVAAALLPAAAGLYMSASAALLLAQRFTVSGIPGWRMAGQACATLRRRWHYWRLGDGVIDLDDEPAAAHAGNKAARLAHLRAQGVCVPAGIILTPAFLAWFAATTPQQREARAKRIWRHFGARALAVRSSAAREDGASKSFAGVFESVLDCGHSGLSAAIARVAQSYRHDRAIHYGNAAITGTSIEGVDHILIQPMIGSRFAGVLFTQDVMSPGHMLVEFVEGHGEALVSGRKTPHILRIGRLTGSVVGGHAPFDVAQLASVARAIETTFGVPQDIEWAWDGARFVILQSRDITTGHGGDVVFAEQRRLIAIAGAQNRSRREDDVVFKRNDMTELLPRPTRASLSLLNAMWRSGGSIDLALRTLGLESRMGEDDPAAYVTVFGALYANAAAPALQAPGVSRLPARRIRRQLAKIEETLRTSFLPQHARHVALLQATDFDSLPLRDLKSAFRHVREEFLTVTHTQISIVNIAAQFALDEARAALEACGAGEARNFAKHFANMPQTHVQTRLATAMSDYERGDMRELAHLLGHRSALDYELASPRHGEHAGTLMSAARQLHFASRMARPAHDEAPLPAAAAEKVAAARRMQALKEDAKHEGLRDLAVLRSILLTLQSRFAIGDIFQLTLEEIDDLDPATAAQLRTLAAERANAALSPPAPLGDRITIAMLEGARAAAADTARDTNMRGLRVSGNETVEGRACVVGERDAAEGKPIATFRDGDIIVAPFIHPAWLPEVLRSGGIVAGAGGWLSHMAIIAREHEIAMVTGVGVKGVARITSGSRIRLLGDGRIVMAHEREALATAAE